MAELLFALFVTVHSGQAAQPTAGERYVEANEARRTILSAWQLITDTHYDAAVVNSDEWLRAREAALNRALTTMTVQRLRDIISELLSVLNASHFKLWPAELAPRSLGSHSRGLDVRVADGQVVITHVHAESEAANQGIRAGDVLVRIDARPVRVAEKDQDRTVRQRVLTDLSREGTKPIDVTLEDRRGARRRVRLPREAESGGSMTGALASATPSVTQERVCRHHCASYLRFDLWLPDIMAPVRSVIADAVRSQLRGIIIDLRGNRGGFGPLAIQVAGYFFSETQVLGTMRSRHSPLQYVANPQVFVDGAVTVGPYQGPVALLIDEVTASTSEVFAAAMQEAGRARIFGQRSAGVALPSYFSALPNGDMLQHAVATFETRGGRKLEGQGVVPDGVVTRRRKYIVSECDAPLEAAMQWLETGSREVHEPCPIR